MAGVDGEPPYKGNYKSRRSLDAAVKGTRTARNRLPDGSPRPTTKFSPDPYFFSRLKARYISAHEPLTLEELAQELATFMRCDEARALGYIRTIAHGEGWKARRQRYWEDLAERALESKAQQSIETFETQMAVLGRRMVQRAEEALTVLEPANVTEAILLLKLGQDTTYRAHRVPNRISRYLNVGEQGGAAESVEAKLQKAPRDEYAAAVQSDLAALAAEVGADPAPGRGDGR
jgi:hypothetical protein